MCVSVYHKTNGNTLKHDFLLVQGTHFFSTIALAILTNLNFFLKEKNRLFLIHFQLLYMEVCIRLTGPLKQKYFVFASE